MALYGAGHCASARGRNNTDDFRAPVAMLGHRRSRITHEPLHAHRQEAETSVNAL